MLHTRERPPVGGTSAAFHACLLLVELGALATFFARDAVLFFVAFEVVLVPMWVLITRFGDAHRPAARADAGARFVLYTAFGSTLMLVGILALVTRSGTADLGVLAQDGGRGLSPTTQLVVASLLVTGLAVKVPVFPLHTWLPAAHTTAPTAGSVLLAAVLLKMGTYGLVRLPLATVPEGFARVAPVLAVLGAVGIIWGGLCLPRRARPQASGRLLLGGAHGFRGDRPRQRHPHRSAGRAVRQRRPRRRLRPALRRRRRPQGTLGQRRPRHRPCRPA